MVMVNPTSIHSKTTIQWWHGRYFGDIKLDNIIKLLRFLTGNFVWVGKCEVLSVTVLLCPASIGGRGEWLLIRARPGRTAAVRIPQLPALSRLRELREPDNSCQKYWQGSLDPGLVIGGLFRQFLWLKRIFYCLYIIFIPTCPIQFYSIKLVLLKFYGWTNWCTVLN